MSTSELRWFRVDRWLWLVFLLLWPPFLLLAVRQSGDPQVLGRYSWRLFGILAAYACGLVLAMAALWWLRRAASRMDRLTAAMAGVRGRTWGWMTAAAIPLIGWIAGLAALRVVGVVPSWTVIAVVIDLTLLVVAWELGLLLVGQPPTRQRQLALRLLLAAISTATAVVLVELTAAILGLGAYLTWDLNPKNIDVRFETADFDIRVVTNRQGLREPATVPRRHPGVYRVIAIGDSMTFGWGVEREDAYPAVAERHLRRDGFEDLEVINMGRPGAGPADYLTYLRRYASRLAPDLIVVGFLVGNDCPVSAPASLRSADEVAAELEAYVSSSRPRLAERWMYESLIVRLLHGALRPPSPESTPGARTGQRGAIFGEPNPLDAAPLRDDIARLRDADGARRRLARLRREGWIDKGLSWRINPWLIRAVILNPGGAADSLAVRPETRVPMHYEWQLAAGLLVEIQRAADEMDVPLVILAIPNAHLVSRRWVEFLGRLGCDVREDMTTARVINEWLAHLCDSRGMTCVDPLCRFRETQRSGAELYLRTDDHMTVAGYELLGESLADALKPIIAERYEQRR